MGVTPLPVSGAGARSIIVRHSDRVWTGRRRRRTGNVSTSHSKGYAFHANEHTRRRDSASRITRTARHRDSAPTITSSGIGDRSQRRQSAGCGAKPARASGIAFLRERALWTLHRQFARTRRATTRSAWAHRRRRRSRPGRIYRQTSKYRATESTHSASSASKQAREAPRVPFVDDLKCPQKARRRPVSTE